MFWECNSVSSSQLESLLEKESVGLPEILEQEDVIQECKNQNKKLIDFLCQPAMLKELINLVVLEPSAALDESERFKLPNIASEILTCENQALTLHIASEESLLQHLYTFVDQPPPLNPLLSSFFSKAFAALLVRKSDQDWYNYQVGYLKVFEFLKTKPVVKDFLRHIGTSSISDLILTLVTCGDDTTVRPMLLNWLDESRLVQSIIELLHPKFSRDTHDNASQLLIAIFPMAREEEYQTVTEKVEDPLLQTLEDPATVDLLLEVMFTPHPETEAYCESSIINGITILLSLLKARNSKSTESTTALGFSAATYHAGTAVPDSEVTTPEEAARQKHILVATINSILPKLPDFTDLLVNPPPKNAMNTTAGPLDPPLGATRLSVAKLVSSLIATNYKDVHLKLIECKTVDILLDLFFKYSLNNFLHAHVEQCIKKVFSFKPISIQKDTDEKKTVSQPKTDKNPTQETPDKSKTEEKTETKQEYTPPDPGPETTPEEEDAKDPTAPKMEETEDTMDTTVPLEDGPLDSSGESESPAKPYENPLLDHLIAQCHLVEKILKGFEMNAEDEARRKQAYMGHLLTIANSLVELLDKSECSEFIRNVMNSCEATSSNWDSFVKEKLVEFNEKNKIVHRYNYSNSMNSLDEDGFKDMQFAQDNTQQANFSNYQMQEMSEHFFDSFGINNEEFNNDSDPSALANAKNISNISFGLDDDTGDDSAKEMFDAVCNQRVGKLPPMSGDDIDDSEDMWENKTREINFATNIEPIPKQSVTQINSSDDEDRDDDDDDDVDTNEDEDNVRSNSTKSSSEKKMDIDNAWPTPDEVEDIPPAMTGATMDTGNPWDSATDPKSPLKPSPVTTPVTETGWADFDNNPAASTDDSNTGSASPTKDESS